MKYIHSLILRIIACFILPAFFTALMAPFTVFFTYLLVSSSGAVVAGRSLIIGESWFNFIDACIAGAAYYLLWVLVMLTKDAAFNTRMKMVFMSFGMLLLGNITRIALLIFLNINFGVEAFEAVHMLWWKVISGIYVAVVWIAVVRYFRVESIPVYDDLRCLWGYATGNRPEKINP